MTGQPISPDIIDQLAEAIARHMPRRIPLAVDLWSNAEIAAYRRFKRPYSVRLKDGLGAYPRSAPNKGLMMDNQCTVLPDGSAFATASWPLPKDHWLYAPRGEWDNARDEYAECPLPILTNAQRQAVTAAARYAIRGATMCGQEQDFDPDALVQNLCYALCGPAGGATLAADKPRFTVHVAGPDDVVPFHDELEAHRYANSVNATYLADRLKNPENEVLCVATVHAGA